MRKNILERIVSVLLIVALSITMIPKYSLYAEAAEGDWAYMSTEEQNAGTAVYDAETDTISFTVDQGFSSRMNYMGLADVSGKDYAIEFDVVAEGGLLGVYSYDDSGSLYGVYLDTNAAILDSLHYTDTETCVDSFKFYETENNLTVHPTVSAINWTPDEDKAGAHLRVEFVRGAEGTLAGGKVNYYKQNKTSQDYLWLGSVNIPSTVTDDTTLANYFGIQMWLGSGTVSNITVTEFTLENKLVHMSTEEQNLGVAVYDKASDTITFTSDGGFAGRMNYTSIPDTSYRDYAIEFDLVTDGGLIGVYNYEQSGNLYGVYLDVNAGYLDALHYTDSSTCVDHFNFYETQNGLTAHATTLAHNWDGATDKAGVHLRVEFVRGAGGTLSGGTVNYYKKDSETGKYLKIGSVKTPSTLTDDATLANQFGIQMWLGSGTVKNLTVTEFTPSGTAANWVHMSEAEQTVGSASYDATNDTITFALDGSMASRMNYKGIEDVSGKDYAIEFDLTATGGMIGVYNYEDNGNLYGVYLDTNAAHLDTSYYTDWSTCADSFNFYETQNGLTVHPTTAAHNWTAADKAGAHLRVEFIRGNGGTLASGMIRYYKLDSNTKEYLKLGSVNIPSALADDTTLPNHFGIQMWLGSGTVSNITVTEFTPNPEDADPLWIHMNDNEETTGTAAYNDEQGIITFTVDNTLSSRMKNTEIKDASGKDYAIEFDMVAEGGLIGIYNYEETGNLYGVYLDTNAAYLDSFHYTDWDTCEDHFNFYETTNGLTTHPVVAAQNWVPNVDKPSSHLRMEFFRGQGGTWAGGTVNFYKKDASTGKYLVIGSTLIPETFTDDPALVNQLGIQMWLGAGTISNITVSEITWTHESAQEQVLNYASHDIVQNKMTFNFTDTMYGRMRYAVDKDVTGQEYAIEFDMDLAGGAIGVYSYEPTNNNLYGVYLDTGAGALDSVRYENGVALDDFAYAESLAGKTPNAAVPCENWTSSDVSGSRIRIVCGQGPDGTLAGGRVIYYKLDSNTDEYVKLGQVDIPSDMADDADAPNHLGIQVWYGSGTLSNITVTDAVYKLTVGGGNTHTDPIYIRLFNGDDIPTRDYVEGKYLIEWTVDGKPITEFDNRIAIDRYEIDFVDTKMLEVKVQDGTITGTGSEVKRNQRFIASVNNLRYNTAGFVFSLSNTNPEIGATGCSTRSTTTVYEELLAEGVPQTVGTVYPGGYSTYMYGLVMLNVPAYNTGTTIYVRAFVTLEDGTPVYGDVRTVNVVVSQ